MDKQWVCPRCGATVLQSQRHRDAGGRLAKHCGCGIRINHILTPEQLSEHKQERIRALKRKYRAQAAAAAGRVFIPKKYRTALHDAHVICFKQHHAEINAAPKRLHDAHVKHYKYLQKAKQAYAIRYAKNPQSERERSSKRKQQLPDSYVVQQLKGMGFWADSVSSELIALKREQMQYRRISREVKTTVKNQLKEDHETINKHS